MVSIMVADELETQGANIGSYDTVFPRYFSINSKKVNKFWSKQNASHFGNDIFKCEFKCENNCEMTIDNNLALIK